jgi:hypothetical protein
MPEDRTPEARADWNEAADNLLLDCAGIRPGSDVLFINERGKGVDPAVVAYLEARARAHGARVRSLWPARAESPEAIPAEVMAAIESAEITIFNHQIGPLLRLRPAAGAGVRVLNYATTPAVIGSAFARVPHALWVAIMERLVARIERARTWRIRCPLGTDMSGTMPPPRPRPANATGFSLRSFPMDTHNPIPSLGASGRIALRWLVTSSMHDLGTEGLALADVVTATVQEGQITGWEGPQAAIDAARDFLSGIAQRYGKPPFVVNSWHAGVNPQACVAFGAKESLEQWMLLAHASPRLLHFHVIGEKVPGEISAAVLDPSVALDGEPLWEAGVLRAFDEPEFQALLAGWSDRSAAARAAFEPNREIGA